MLFQQIVDVLEETTKEQLSLTEKFEYTLQQSVKRHNLRIHSNTLAITGTGDKRKCHLEKAGKFHYTDLRDLIQKGLTILKYMNTSVEHKTAIKLTRIQIKQQSNAREYYSSTNSKPFQLRIQLEKAKAELLKIRMMMHLSLCEKFLDFTQQVSNLNIALIQEQTELYELASRKPDQVDYFLKKAERISILDAEEILNISFNVIQYLNDQNAQQMDRLEYELTKIRRITDDNNGI